MSKKEKKALKRLVIAAHVVAFTFGLLNAGYTTYEHFHRKASEAKQDNINQVVVGAVQSLFDAQQAPEQKQSLHKNRAEL